MKWLHRALNFVAIAAPVVVGVLTGPLSLPTLLTGIGSLAAKLTHAPGFMTSSPGEDVAP